MFDIGMTELMVIGIVALIVVGPKDLPGMFRTLGRFTARAKGMAREFTRAMEDAAKDSGVDDVSKTIKGVANPKKMGLDALNSAADSFEKWDPMKGKSSSKTPKPVSAKAADADAAEWSAHEAKVRAEQAADAAEMADEPEVTDTAAEAAPAKASAKKPAAKKPAAKKPAAKKPAAKTAATDSADAATKAPAAKAPAKKPAAKKPAAKKPAAKKPAAKKPAATKTAATKTTAKKATPKAQAPQTEEKGS